MLVDWFDQLLLLDDVRPLLSSVTFFHQSAVRFFHLPLPAKPAQSEPPVGPWSDEPLAPALLLLSLSLLSPSLKCKSTFRGALLLCTCSAGAPLLLRLAELLLLSTSSGA